MKYRNFLFTIMSLFIMFPSFSQEWKQQLDSANSCKANNRFEEAISFYKKAGDLLRKDSLYSETYIQTYTEIANIYYSFSEFSTAASYYEEVRSLIDRRQGKMNKDYAFICNRLGTSYQQSGNLDTALVIHLQTLDIRKIVSGTTSDAYAQSCNNLGELYRSLGQYEKSELLLLKAMEIREKLTPEKGSPSYAITCVSLANLYRDLGKYKESEALYIEAKRVRKEQFTTEDPRYAYSCNILADLYAYMQQPAKAEPLYLEAKQLREKRSKESSEYGESCNNLGALYRDNNEFLKAEPLLLEAKKIFEKLYPGGNPSLTINYNNLGELYYAMGKFMTAEFFYLQARNSWAQDLGKEHPYYVTNSDEMARLYRDAGKPEKADSLIRETSFLKYKQLNRVFQFTSEKEKNQYIKLINGSADEYLSFYFTHFPHTHAGPAYTISLLNRNLILSSLQQTRYAIYESGDAGLAGIFSNWTTTRQQLAGIYSRGVQADTSKLKILEGRADQLEKELSRGSASFKKIQTIPDWKDLRDKLSEHEAAIEFAEFRVFKNRSWTDSEYYVALIIRNGLPEPLLVPLFEKKQLDLLLSSRNADSKQGINLNYTSIKMYNLVWKPLEKYLSGISKIYFAPAGMLHKVAMAGLKMNNNQVLSDKYRLVQLLTTASLSNQEEASLSMNDKLFLYGAVNYSADSASLQRAVIKYKRGDLATRSIPGDLPDKDGDRFFEPLPNSAAEIEGIARSAKEKNITALIFQGAEANEESVKSLDKEGASFVLHISTHGFFNPDPKKDTRYSKDTIAKVFKRSDNPLFRGGLILAGAENTWRGHVVEGVEDGILTGYEVSNMFFPHNKLVVLSACQTALGDVEGSEGVYGLQRAFKIAGTENLVMSLWKVPDDVTAEFMQVFYKTMFDNIPISESFYMAQQAMKKKYRNEPYKWAAWILVR